MVGIFEERIFNELEKMPFPSTNRTLIFFESVTQTATNEFDHTLSCQIKAVFGIHRTRVEDTVTLDEKKSVLKNWINSTIVFLKKKNYNIEVINENTLKISKS